MIMDKILEKLNKLSLPAVILVASLILGGFFYASQVNKQRSIERQQQIKIETEKQEQLAKELKEQEAKEEAEQALNTCIGNAEDNYSDRWHKECKAQGKLTSKCIDINELSFDEYLKKYGLTSEEYVKERNLTPSNPDDPVSARLSASFDYILKRPSECSCRLAIDPYVNLFDKGLDDDKAECLRRYPQN
ncbi:MAG: hypothetical protein COU09_00140 [Candidatus Harrisonbacteria bacterium CG10_big_fil_rev_8_21_14_0_10_44_23]|uniref:Uncharacterized protein n=1 Tax=Candidatus Harrisonbacteria bacterium CG10_big_fil_rev_8_21_14_0_10_44_23 TaxID=1974585 RepID=A0A2H0UT58_9BACT|nr:MAG: hypothetical protein COU09_00140 [Candidatus Harrisonbacteria bacterium CG10_big_fil_rev_8_21_14_0_10_44_23]